MQKNRTKVTIICSLGLYLLLVVFSFIDSTTESFNFAGFYGILFCFYVSIISLFFFIFKKVRDIGKGLLISSLIIGVIGFSICSLTK